jgi:uncharacterized protein (TIGR00369 family)
VPVLGVGELQTILQGGFPDSEVPHVEEVNDEFVLMSYAITDRHGRPGGTVAGPVMMSLADTSAWVAIMSQIGPIVLAVTTSLHIDFLRKPELTDLMARARILKLGKRLAVVDVELFSRGSTELVAKSQVTYSIPPRSTP